MAREKGCTRDKLVGHLWPESSDERARHLLSDSIYILRKALGDPAVTPSGDVLRLNPEIVRTDAVAFLASLEEGELEGAVELYEGPFLDGFSANGSLELEHWMEAQRLDLEGRYAAALEALACRAEESGDFNTSASWWRRLAVHDPYNSRAVMRQMEALAAAGDRANALQVAKDHELLLKKDLELEPPPELAALVERLRDEKADSRHVSDVVIGVASRAAVGIREPAVRQQVVEQTPGSRLRRKSVAAVSLIAIVILIALASRQLLRTGAGTAERKSIAVLPFENLTGDPDNDYLAAGFHEEVISQLAKVSDVRVIARSSVLEYKDNPGGLGEIAEELGVDNILEASVRSQGDRIRVTVQLIDPVRNDHVWAENYDRERGDLLDVQTDVALRIAENLRADLSLEERARIERVPTKNREAYDYYLRGVTFESYYEFKKAQQMYERAVEIDPEFALALAQLGYVSSHRYFFSEDRTSDLLEKSKDAIDRALALDPDLFEGHIARHYYFFAGFRDYESALVALERARELRPNDAEVYRRLGLVTRRVGKFEEGLEYLERALNLSPRYRSLLINAATTAIWMRDYPAAERFIERGFDISPDDVSLFHWQALLYTNVGDTIRASQAYSSWVHQKNSHVPEANTTFWRAMLRILHESFREALREHTLSTMGADTVSYHYLKALSYLTTGEERLARAHCDSGLVVEEARYRDFPADSGRVDRSTGRSSYLPIFYAGLGRTEDAIDYLSADAQDPPDFFAVEGRRYSLAEVYVMGGDYDAAIDQIEYLLSVPSAVSVPQLKMDPIWDPLRKHPRFVELLEAGRK
jgi:TolB-like protein/DNA-binding SARP family transcriptional activator/Tfp pilus assembly protein PilF